MRRPHMSTGAWLFAGLIGAALIAPAGVYAAVNSKVAIGNAGPSTVTAMVTPQHQLLATTVDPKQMFTFTGSPSKLCETLYKPEGKALMLTNVTFYLHPTGSLGEAILEDSSCSGNDYDVVFTTQSYVTVQHTYPAGLPVDSITLGAEGIASVVATGYYIQPAQLPPTLQSSATTGLPKPR